jgi:DNA polymerase/3'-5' exonuclease PolX
MKLRPVPPEERSLLEAYEPIKTEEDIFRALQLDFIPPTERVSKGFDKPGE